MAQFHRVPRSTTEFEKCWGSLRFSGILRRFWPQKRAHKGRVGDSRQKLLKICLCLVECFPLGVLKNQRRRREVLAKADKVGLVRVRSLGNEWREEANEHFSRPFSGLASRPAGRE